MPKNKLLLERGVISVPAAAPMLITKALSQDVMPLAFVPLSLIPKELPSRNEDHLIFNSV
ncbi:hypothetical protein B1B04_16145 [Lysinibacillus sp. KCTC 33748]|nr:hypothetical protein B1B04_16145 [Lysinibacillus sp. KCTC 33748]